MLPDCLDVETLKRRLDVDRSSRDEELGEYLEAAVAVAQGPEGCGRLLLPDPVPVLDEEGSDSSEPVVRLIRSRGRRLLVPDARQVTNVEVLPDPVPGFDEEGEDTGGVEVAGYQTVSRDGVIVRIDLPHHRRLGGPFDGWPDDFFPDRLRRQRTFRVTGRFGIIDIPFDLREAIYTLAARIFYERNAQFADQVAFANGEGVQQYYRQLPPRTKLAFAAYRLPAAHGGLP